MRRYAPQVVITGYLHDLCPFVNFGSFLFLKITVIMRSSSVLLQLYFYFYSIVKDVAVEVVDVIYAR